MRSVSRSDESAFVPVSRILGLLSIHLLLCDLQEHFF